MIKNDQNMIKMWLQSLDFKVVVPMNNDWNPWMKFTQNDYNHNHHHHNDCNHDCNHNHKS